ncbi:uncharacterized protein BXIN_2108 [Babesia sp. Xinjiang]|uniref:uncharacterized protein n=1 Tax=Babesia sp. Xinjiang TaxID=462227 RepID=UPI000A2277BD|nr:uncharacterized protein BXIN_2108 [Babesia sp. Xinjiang]ORM40630.1 hypothetical protein BXIN_2108 [Babesia sp. Xinjiang]
MVSFGRLWSRSIDLWVRAVLKDLQRRRIRALLRILTTLSDLKGFRALCQAIIHCRGDLSDPVISLLLRLCEFSHCEVDSEPSYVTEHSTLQNTTDQCEEECPSQPREQERLDPSRILSRCILATLTPTLLHVLLSRRKESMRSQGIWHCYSAITDDITTFLESTGGGSMPSTIRCWSGVTRLRSIRAFRPRPILLGLSASDSLDYALLKSKGISSLLRQVDLSESHRETEIVQRVKDSEVGNANPVDNTSGLKAVIISISNLCTVREPPVVPSSLYELYEHMQNDAGPVSSRIENAVVYLQRLRLLDLEHKTNRSQVLREAAKDYASLRQSCDRPIDVPLHETGIWSNLKRMFRIKSVESNQRLPSFKTRKPGSILVRSPLCQPVDDRQTSLLFGRCLLFCSGYINVFSKVYKAVQHASSAATTSRHDRLLLLAARAMLLNFRDQVSFANKRTLNLNPPLMVYYTFLRVVEAACHETFFAITPKSLYPPTKLAIEWVANAMFAYCNSGNCTAYKTSKSAARKSDASSNASVSTKSTGDTSVTEPPAAAVFPAASTKISVSGKSLGAVLANRREIVESLSKISGRRIHLSEGSALSILRAHAVVFKINFDHLREAFRQIEEAFRILSFHKKRSLSSRVTKEYIVDRVGDVFSGRLALLPGDTHRSFYRLLVPFALYTYAECVFTTLSERVCHDMYPRAFWVARSHMSLLSCRLRGRIPDLHL